ncbi:NACHT domain-containing protein [Streptomyces sioyaensis]|uniref:NACHT domain-containing protein n=1 Tax=Streptomyces sioyaensis TaxID=67364 RepID=UPI0037B6C1EC
MWRIRRQSVTHSTIGRDLVMNMYGEPAGTELDRAARQLRDDVLSRARRAVARLGLQRPTLIEVSWKGSSRPVQPSQDVLGVAPGELAGTVTQVVDTCRSLPLHQLVVLGEAGTGKSVLATLLVHDMAQGEPRPGDPVPVLMPLSSWRPAIPMGKWIVRQIRQNSPRLTRRGKFGAGAAARLFDAGRVMPVLDGLDELPEPLRARAVEEIEAVIPSGCWLLVTSRGDEYEQTRHAGSHLTRAAVVELEAVERKFAITYLERSKVTGDGRWDPVFDAMRGEPDSMLARTMASPLMLYLAQEAYRASSSEPGELASKKLSREDIEDTLLNRYLPAVYREYQPSRYKEARARRYLGLMARQMRRDGTVDFAWWQVNARLTGPLVGVAFGSVWGWFLQVLFGPVLGVATGLLAGLGGWAAHAVVRSNLKQVYVPEGAVHGPKALIQRYALIGVASALAVAGVTAASAGWWLAKVLKAAEPVAWHYGTLVGAASGAATLLGSAWGSYQVSRLWFRLTGRLPWRLLSFLEDAHELGVMRQIGAVHQFRHERVLRLLGGRVLEKSSRSVHGQWNDKWQRWRPLLPVFASLVQVGSALSGLALVSMMYASTTQVELDYRSGDRPGYRMDPSGCPIGTACTGVAIWSWNVPRHASRHTVWLPARLHGRSLQGWSGTIKADGCAGGAVKVTLAMAGEAPAAFTLDNSAQAPTADLPQPVRPERRPVSLTLRRLDDRPCSLLVEWTGPGLVDDGLEPARRRLGVTARAAVSDRPGADRATTGRGGDTP